MKKLRLVLFSCLVIGLSIAAMSFKDEGNKLFDIAKNIEIFTSVYKELNTNFVDDIDPSTIMKTGLDAMLASLDPYTNYYSENDIEGARTRQKGQYFGIGAQIEAIGDELVFTSVNLDGPAYLGGILVGDVIKSVDGQSTAGRSATDIDFVMRGFPGTTLNLQVDRPGQGRQTIAVERKNVESKNVPYFTELDQEVGYINLTVFTQNAARNVADALQDLKLKNPNLKGVILDLRNNGGGLLGEAVNIVNIFSPKGQVVVTTKGRVIDWDKAYSTTRDAMDADIPLAVLINKNSASASEIVSGSIQDLDRGVLIGQRSYGKGLVQNFKDVGYNAQIKLTTAKYYIPSGRCIQSVEYHDGEPVDIPDDQRAVFKTTNGRKVLDGGGILPDIVLPHPEEGDLMKALNDEHVIFNFVTHYLQSHPDPVDSLELYEFADFDAFQKYLKSTNFQYKTEAEKTIETLNEQLDKLGLAANTSQPVNQAIQNYKSTAVQDHRVAIMHAIEEQIVSRSYYEEGRIRLALRDDSEVKKAISVLTNASAYQKILK